jgi:hypothetical protein
MWSRHNSLFRTEGIKIKDVPSIEGIVAGRSRGAESLYPGGI